MFRLRSGLGGGNDPDGECRYPDDNVTLYAWCFDSVLKWDRSFDLSVLLPNGNAPQSYAYTNIDFHHVFDIVRSSRNGTADR